METRASNPEQEKMLDYRKRYEIVSSCNGCRGNVNLLQALQECEKGSKGYKEEAVDMALTLLGIRGVGDYRDALFQL